MMQETYFNTLYRKRLCFNSFHIVYSFLICKDWNYYCSIYPIWKLVAIRCQICYTTKTKPKTIKFFYIVTDRMISFLIWRKNVISQSTINVWHWWSVQYNLFVIITHFLPSRKVVLEKRFFIWKSFT